MKPPYEITPTILKYIALISEKIGEINARLLDKPSPRLRKQNRIKTIHNSLKIEGNTLTEQQITAIIDEKHVVGPEKDILEVLNTIKAYQSIEEFKLYSEKDFLNAHKMLMTGLITNPGKYRKEGVGIVKGDQLEHIAPPFENVPFLMKDLFSYIKSNTEINLIKSCVFHYEMEFIHPFLDGNGRMGRLWQTIILRDHNPIFEFIPLETLISKSQKDYYQALSKSDRKGNSAYFIEYMLEIIYRSLEQTTQFGSRKLKQTDRLNYFVELGKTKFTRKEYLHVFKEISSATASRDLNKGIALNLFTKEGEKNKTVYLVK